MGQKPMRQFKPNGLFARLAPEGEGCNNNNNIIIIVLVSPNLLDRKGNNKVSKCKFKKHLFGNKMKETSMNFAT